MPSAERVRPRRAIAALAGVVLAAIVALALLSTSAAAEPGAWRRGVNMADYLAYPSGDTWPIFRGPRTTTTDAEFARLAAAGFDFIRLAVEPAPFLERSAAEIADSERRLVSFVTRAQAHGLKVMIAGFARPEYGRLGNRTVLAPGDGSAYRRYMAFLKRMIELTRGSRLDMLSLAPMNEPQAECTRSDGGPDWSQIQRAMITELRAAAPRLTLVLTTGCWSRLDALAAIRLGDYDANTLIDLHYYEPWTFTHQSAQWSVGWISVVAGLSYPPSRTDRQIATDASARLFVTRRPTGTPKDFEATIGHIDYYIRATPGPERIRADMATIAQWAKAESAAPARIVIGEFGSYRPPLPAGPPEDGSRLRWLEAVRTAAEAEGFGWAMWSYHAEFGMVTDEATGALDRHVIEALGLTVR